MTQTPKPRVLSWLSVRLRRPPSIIFSSLLLILFGSVVYLKRTHHIFFDAHHTYPIEETTLAHWLAGWFKDWDEGPLTVGIMEGPGILSHNRFSKRAYLWHLRQIDPDARILMVSKPSKEDVFVLSWLPKSKEAVVFGRNLVALYATTSTEASINDDRMYRRIPAHYLSAWQPYRWSITKQMNRIDMGIATVVPAESLNHTVFVPDGGEPCELKYDFKAAKWVRTKLTLTE